MEQATTPPASPTTTSAASEQERANAALAASVARLDELGLYDEQGRVVVEPAVTFHSA